MALDKIVYPVLILTISSIISTIVCAPDNENLTPAGETIEVKETGPIRASDGGYDLFENKFFINDDLVKQKTAQKLFSAPVYKAHSKFDFPDLTNSFATCEYTRKSILQTFDNRWDVKDLNGVQYVALMDGINDPSVVNRLRYYLLTYIANSCFELIAKLRVAFDKARFSSNKTLVDNYILIKTKLFRTIEAVLQKFENLGTTTKATSAAAVAAAIIAPEFIIVVQVGDIQIVGYRDTHPFYLTIDQSRSSIDEKNQFGLANCANIMEMELCKHTRIVGAPQTKTWLSPTGQRPTHTLQPFIKLYKRVHAPYLNDEDVVIGHHKPPIPVSSEAYDTPDKNLDSANQLVDFDEAIHGSLDESDILQSVQESWAIQFLVFETEYFKSLISPHQISRIVVSTMHNSRDKKTISSELKEILKLIVSDSKRASPQDFVSNVKAMAINLHIDNSLLIVALEDDKSKYHF